MEQEIKREYSFCTLCERKCGVDRTRGELGFCRQTSGLKLSRAALHMWEEPVISGERGSGAIFFSGCSLGCVYCQNSGISHGGDGLFVEDERLCEIMLELQAKGAHNINLVTPTHFAPTVVEQARRARKKGLYIPIVYNTGSYDSVNTLKLLEGTVDIYLPDFKYYLEKTGRYLSRANDYPSTAKTAVLEMVRQIPTPIVENGLMKRGVIVRVLLLPMHLGEAKLTVKYLYETFGNSIYISLMSQYTPMPGMKAPLDRRVTVKEYEELVDYAEKIGVVNGFTQERGSAEESFIPSFDYTGVEKK